MCYRSSRYARQVARGRGAWGRYSRHAGRSSWRAPWPCAWRGAAPTSPTATSGTGTARGTLLKDPPLRIASLDAATFGAELGATASGAQLLEVAGTPTCGVDFYYIQYNTVDGTDEPTTASGALMVPTGSSAQCSGGRPIVLYGHATDTDRATNIADITNTGNTEGALIAAMFAAQGYIVVAPNYAGYDTSTLSYHPYLNADQQSKDMIDALAAARTALPGPRPPAPRMAASCSSRGIPRAAMWRWPRIGRCRRRA